MGGVLVVKHGYKANVYNAIEGPRQQRT